MATTTEIDFPVLKNDLLLRSARGEPTDRAPVWIMRQAGRYLPEFRALRAENEFFKVCRTPELACEITLQPIRRFPGLDAAIIFSDILVIPAALGLEVLMIPGKGPSFPVTIDTPEDIEKKLNINADIEKELEYVGQALTLTRHKLEGQVPLIGFAGAPWTLMAYMIEGGGSKTWAKAQKWLYTQPEASHKLLTIITDAVIRFLILQVKAGAQLLQVFDSWAGELSIGAFRDFALPYLGRIATEVKKQCPTVPLIVFAKGAHHSSAELAMFPYDVLSLDWTADVPLVKQQLAANPVVESDTRALRPDGTRVSLQGNMNPAVLYASKEVIRAEFAKVAAQFGSQSYIANLGHGLSPDHLPEHVGHYIDAVHDITSQKQ